MYIVRWALVGAISVSLSSFHLGACADEPTLVARWDFDENESVPLEARGDVELNHPGPRPPDYPGFDSGNKAARFDGLGSHFSVADPGPNSPFDFTRDDAISLEAWVRLDELRDGNPMYVVGKGRTGSAGFARDNQNWALRIVGAKGVAKVSFLFATAKGSGTMDWHRWTSTSGFASGSGWHHIAVAYHFGKPDSISGWVDGVPTGGTWDLGGATAVAPVVDDDEVWIGSSQSGNPSNSFRGWLDAVAIHRRLLTDDDAASRFQRVGGPRIVGPLTEVMPDLGDIADGRVLVTISEGLPAHDRWLNQGEQWPRETARWHGDAFLLPRIPLRFDDWGIRKSWNAPLLIRMAADVDLPTGSTRLLLRARSLSRLWIHGVVFARTEAVTVQPPNGEEPVTPIAKPPSPGLRAHGYHQQEVLSEPVTIAGRPGETLRCRVVLEMVVGGKNYRSETGEVCVAVETEDGRSFSVLRPAGRPEMPLTDTHVETALQSIESSLSTYDDQSRRKASASRNSFWDGRHATAREWARLHPAPAIPEPGGNRDDHPVDAFIAAKIDRALQASVDLDVGQAEFFHDDVLPILRENCIRCHGDKKKGGLKLDTRAAAVRGGDSETPAIVPGDSDTSELMARVRSEDESLRMPPTGDALTRKQIAVLEHWIGSGAPWPAAPVSAGDVALSPLTNDSAFLRRIYLDTIGVPPTAAEAAAFLADRAPDKRRRLIDRLLSDDRGADHWMSFWLDLLAENPTLLNASLNSTGPFRWFIYDSLRDNKPLDRMVTELILMRGGQHDGGSAGFGMAAENDAPLAAKGHILASAFLGIELQCARCHDSPYHSTTQQDLYSLAAMLARKPIRVPETSRVPAAFFEENERESLIRVSLPSNQPVAAAWPFADVTGVRDSDSIDALMMRSGDSRERLAALMTAPWNGRFARVIVNRIWRRFLGAGFVEPVHDWEGRESSHPELLDWLAHQLIAHDYDVRHVTRLIVTSRTYQRAAGGRNLEATANVRFFNLPERRRLSAEQIVDSIHQATDIAMNVEELTFVHDGRRAISNRLTLGRPRRAWMFASLNNERDRPSLSLPKARAVTDVLEAFGWTGSRQKPINDRDLEPNVLQPGVLANGLLVMTATRASQGSELANQAVAATSAVELVENLFLRVLGRYPNDEELAAFTAALDVGFADRVVPPQAVPRLTERPPLPLVTWFNHLRPDANTIQQEVERRVQEGPPPDVRLRPAWREVYEDLAWSLINHREFVWVP